MDYWGWFTGITSIFIKGRQEHKRQRRTGDRGSRVRKGDAMMEAERETGRQRLADTMR